MKTTFAFAVKSGPITPDAAGGGPGIYWTHLRLLAATQSAVDLVFLSPPGQEGVLEEFRRAHPDQWRQLEETARSIHVLALQEASDTRQRFRNATKFVLSPAAYGAAAWSEDSITRTSALFDKLKTNVVWAEHPIALQVAVRSAHDRPIIYAHLDWLWKLRRLREKPVSIPRVLQGRLVEARLVRRAAGVITGSAADQWSLRSMVPSGAVLYMPPLYDEIPLSLGHDEPVGPLRLVHLGGMRTTASRLGLDQFLRDTWPQVRQQCELLIVGSLDKATERILQAIEVDEQVRATGFIEDLSAVLRPFDVFLVPWPYETGTRTRIPLGMRHAQVVVATPESASTIGGLVDGENCLIAPVHAMAAVITELANDPKRRRRLGIAARLAFMEGFTEKAWIDRFGQFVDGVVEQAAASR